MRSRRWRCPRRRGTRPAPSGSHRVVAEVGRLHLGVDDVFRAHLVLTGKRAVDGVGRAAEGDERRHEPKTFERMCSAIRADMEVLPTVCVRQNGGRTSRSSHRMAAIARGVPGAALRLGVEFSQPSSSLSREGCPTARLGPAREEASSRGGWARERRSALDESEEGAPVATDAANSGALFGDAPAVGCGLPLIEGLPSGVSLRLLGRNSCEAGSNLRPARALWCPPDEEGSSAAQAFGDDGARGDCRPLGNRGRVGGGLKRHARGPGLQLDRA